MNISTPIACCTIKTDERPSRSECGTRKRDDGREKIIHFIKDKNQ
jgi:hypothetical protein